MRIAVIAGGQDSMTEATHVMSGLRGGCRAGHLEVQDSMLTDGLVDAFHGVHMGVTAERLAQRYQITRGEQDEFALKSQMKATAAIERDRFGSELVPIVVAHETGETQFAKDE